MNAKVAEIKNKAEAVVKAQALDVLIETFEMTNEKNGPEIPHVRGWIMDELEARNPEAFDAWIDSTDDSPRAYFLS